MNSRKLAYTDSTTAYLVAGRVFRLQFDDDTVFDELAQRIDELAAELDRPLVVLPEGDFSETGVAISAAPVSCVVGLLVNSATTYNPRRLAHDALVTAVASAAELPWERVVDAIPPGTPLDDVALRLTACGPLAGGLVGYGVLVELRDEDDDEFVDGDEEETAFFADETGPAGTVPGLELVRGNTMNQEPQGDAVYGVQVARALYDGTIPVAVHVSGDAHDERVAKLGDLAADSTYYLVGHFD